MNAKDKANELIDKFAPIMPNEHWHYKASQCAIISVDEILKSFDEEWTKLDFWTDELGNTIKFWQDVKKELELLK